MARRPLLLLLALVALSALAGCTRSGPTQVDCIAGNHNPPGHRDKCVPDSGSSVTSPSPTADDDVTPSTAQATASSPTVPPAARDSACRSDPLANVYHPTRLRVITPCVTVSGTVRIIRPEQDGDIHFDLELDSPFAGMVNDANRGQQDGYLVVEIIPADEAGCTVGQSPRQAVGTYDYGVCTGANLVTPAIGSHVAVTGPYVLDTAHGWMEVHPAWAVVPDGANPSPAPAGSPTPTPSTTVAGGVYYANCTAARAAGVAPLHRSDPGYRPALDRDGDGVACE